MRSVYHDMYYPDVLGRAIAYGPQSVWAGGHRRVPCLGGWGLHERVVSVCYWSESVWLREWLGCWSDKKREEVRLQSGV